MDAPRDYNEAPSNRVVQDEALTHVKKRILR